MSIIKLAVILTKEPITTAESIDFSDKNPTVDPIHVSRPIGTDLKKNYPSVVAKVKPNGIQATSRKSK